MAQAYHWERGLVESSLIDQAETLMLGGASLQELEDVYWELLHLQQRCSPAQRRELEPTITDLQIRMGNARQMCYA